MSKAPPALLKPPPLRAGDVVGIVAPASNVERAALERGCEGLRALGYQPFYFDSIFAQDLYFAGSRERRVRELHEMFARPEVRAIVCARGGYGCNYLLDQLDLAVIRSNPKILVGYSDLTALLTYLHDAIGLVTFHGPMVAKDFASELIRRPAAKLPRDFEPFTWPMALGGEFARWELVGPTADAIDTGIRSLVAGSGEGRIYGGCLSILCASLGTPYEVQTEDTILFLEDMNEKPYQVDRLLVQLARAGKLHGVRGIVFGEMLGCSQSPGGGSGWGTQPGQDYTLEEAVQRVLRLHAPDIPVAYGLRSGHVSHANVTLPLGVRARLEVAEKAKLSILESPTVMGPAAVAAWNARAPEAWKI